MPALNLAVVQYLLLTFQIQSHMMLAIIVVMLVDFYFLPQDFDLKSFSIICDICFASGINYTGGMQIKIYFLGSIYHLKLDKNKRHGKTSVIRYDWRNIQSGKVWSGNSLVGEVSVGGVFIEEVSVEVCPVCSG